MAVKMYSTRWCADCWRAKRFLKRNDVVFEEINIDDSEEAAELVMRHNEGKRRVPTFDIDGSYHGNPPLGELARLLGIPQTVGRARAGNVPRRPTFHQG